MKLNRKWTLKSDELKTKIVNLLHFTTLNIDENVKRNDLIEISKDYLDIYLVTKYLMNDNKNLDNKEIENFKDIKIEKKQNERKILLEALNDLVSLELKEEKHLNLNNVLNMFTLTIETNFSTMKKTFSHLDDDTELNQYNEKFKKCYF